MLLGTFFNSTRDLVTEPNLKYVEGKIQNWQPTLYDLYTCNVDISQNKSTVKLFSAGVNKSFECFTKY